MNKKILYFCQAVIETLTGTQCSKCSHNKLGGYMCDSNEYEKCIHSIYPVGFHRAAISRRNRKGEHNKRQTTK